MVEKWKKERDEKILEIKWLESDVYQRSKKERRQTNKDFKNHNKSDKKMWDD